MKLTRRQLAILAVAATPSPAAAQQPAPPADDLQQKRDLMRAAAQAVANHPVPMATEPAFQFKA